MGIQDFNLDQSQNADRVLVINSDEESAKRITNILEKRSYGWQVAATPQTAAQLAADQLFDLVIFECQDLNFAPAEFLGLLRADSGLKRSPLIVLHPDPEKVAREGGFINGKDYHVIQSPFKPSDLIVKVSTQLRLRKLKSSDSKLDDKIGAQNSQLRDLNTRYQKELKEAKYIQQSILPKSLPVDDRCFFAAHYVPLEAVGGDIYDVWKTVDGNYGMFIGDVTGHGLPAAFIGAMTKMALNYAPQVNPDEMLAHMNDGVSNVMPEERFITVEAAIYNPETGLLKIARGGHPPAFVHRAATGEVEQIFPKGLALGMLVGARYQALETTLQPGDKLLFISDGLIEQENMKGEMLGNDGIAKMFAEIAKDKDIRECIPEILRQYDEFCGGRILKDDNTLVGLQRTK